MFSKLFVVALVVLITSCATGAGLALDPSLGVDPHSLTRSRSGLLYQDVREGTGRRALPGDTVVMHYTGWLADGTRFEATRERGQPLVTVIGPRSRLVKGWNEGIQGMRPGGRRTLVIPPSLGYGSRGVDGVIPGNATLVFDVELLELR